LMFIISILGFYHTYRDRTILKNLYSQGTESSIDVE
jgi:hypothetical protein